MIYEYLHIYIYIYIYTHIYIYEVYAKSALIDPKNGTLNLRNEILNMIGCSPFVFFCHDIVLLVFFATDIT